MDLAVAVALGVIILLAAFDLWVGVANDAVNFLNSAIGSRVASRRVILLVAATETNTPEDFDAFEAALKEVL